MLSNYLIIVVVLSAAAFISVKAGKLTPVAGITGWITGLLIFAGTGYAGAAMLATFFVLGTTATSWGTSVKQKLGLAEKDKGRRTAGQVIANAGVAALLGTSSFFYPSKTDVFLLMIAAGFASAAADTLSSELGNMYGKNFYNVVTLKKDTRGLNGVISFEGTAIGLLGSCIIAVVYSLFFSLTIHFLLIVVAGTAGNFTDSLLGATFERKGYLNNNEVNFLNTAIASLSVLLLLSITNNF
jgi:uncharacterized protein (TIGR00297 family)